MALTELGINENLGFEVTGGPANVSDTNRKKFVSETELDTAIGSTHKAADKPYLTANDKVYAARLALGGLVAP